MAEQTPAVTVARPKPGQYVRLHAAPRWLPMRVNRWLARHNLTRSAWGFVMEDNMTEPKPTTCCGRPAPVAGEDHAPCCEEHGCCDGEPHDA